MSYDESVMILNMDDLETKRRLMSKVGTLTGLYEVKLKPRRRTRSNNQNAYYWSAFITGFTEWLRDEWGDPSITTEQAHIALKSAVLGTKEKVDKKTGEVIELIPTTHDLDTWEFSNYLEKAAEWLARICGIVVLTPEMYFEEPPKSKKAKDDLLAKRLEKSIEIVKKKKRASQ